MWRQPLSELQKPYLARLETAFQTLASATEGTLPYTGEDWDSLSAVYAQAVENIKAAQDTGAMETARDNGIAAMKAVPTAAERVAHVVDSWQNAHSQALACLVEGKLTQVNAPQVEKLAALALAAASQEKLAVYCPLTGEADKALVLGTASAQLQTRTEKLMTLGLAAQWLAGLGTELIQRPMSQVSAQHLEEYQSALAACSGLDESMKRYISDSVQENLSVRYELAGHKRSAAQTLQQEYETLNLQDLEPGTLEADTPLFADDGLGLDSVDALELVVMVERDYGITIDGKDEAKTIFASLDALADYIIARK